MRVRPKSYESSIYNELVVGRLPRHLEEVSRSKPAPEKLRG